MIAFTQAIIKFCKESGHKSLKYFFIKDIFLFFIQKLGKDTVEKYLFEFLDKELEDFDLRIVILALNYFIDENDFVIVKKVVMLFEDMGKIKFLDLGDIIHKLLVKGKFQISEEILLLQPISQQKTQACWEDFIEHMVKNH